MFVIANQEVGRLTGFSYDDIETAQETCDSLNENLKNRGKAPRYEVFDKDNLPDWVRVDRK